MTSIDFIVDFYLLMYHQTFAYKNWRRVEKLNQKKLPEVLLGNKW